jgi:hypothetical protein
VKERVRRLRASEDESRLVAECVREERATYYLDGILMKPRPDDLDGIAFGSHGRVAYVAGVRIRVGETASDAYDFVTTPVFSPDGRRVAFGAAQGREIWRKVMDVGP